MFRVLSGNSPIILFLVFNSSDSLMSRSRYIRAGKVSNLSAHNLNDVITIGSQKSYGDGVAG